MLIHQKVITLSTMLARSPKEQISHTLDNIKGGSYSAKSLSTSHKIKPVISPLYW